MNSRITTEATSNPDNKLSIGNDTHKLNPADAGSLAELASALRLSHSQQERLRTSITGHELLAIFERQALTPVFQPIVDLKTHQVFAHEALVRGPKNSFLHNPLNLLQVAEEHDCLFELDWLARFSSIHSYKQQQASSLLFLNVSVNTIMQKTHRSGITLEYLHFLGIPIDSVVIEITELQPVEDFSAFISSVEHYRNMGFKVAVDDLGAGYNGLRIWSELRPDFVKIDHHFVSNLHDDHDKLHFMETLCQLALQLDSRIVAEGVESLGELHALQTLGVDYAQGYLFQRPQESISNSLDFNWNPITGNIKELQRKKTTIASMVESPFIIDDDFNVMQVARYFFANPDTYFLPVIINDKIQGMVWRDTIMTHIARSLDYLTSPNSHITAIMDREAITLPVDTALNDAADILVTAQTEKRNTAFIITDNGHYVGCSTLANVLAGLVKK